MTSWEYRQIYLADGEAVDTLNEYGADGWECFYLNEQTRIAWLKRPRRQIQEQGNHP